LKLETLQLLVVVVALNELKISEQQQQVSLRISDWW
jgi:hypothetical protein